MWKWIELQTLYFCVYSRMVVATWQCQAAVAQEAGPEQVLAEVGCTTAELRRWIFLRTPTPFRPAITLAAPSQTSIPTRLYINRYGSFPYEVNTVDQFCFFCWFCFFVKNMYVLCNWAANSRTRDYFQTHIVLDCIKLLKLSFFITVLFFVNLKSVCNK